MKFVLFMAMFFVLKGANAFFFKKAQDGRVTTVELSILFTFIYSTYQFAAFWLFPPYRGLDLRPEVVIWPVLYSVFFLLMNVLLALSLNNGPAGVTNTIQSFHIIVPMLVGQLIWNETMTVTKALGLLLFVVSIILFNSGSYSVNSSQRQRLTPKWWAFCLLATLFAGCSVCFTKQGMNLFPDLGKDYLIIYNMSVMLITGPFLLLRWKKALPLLREPSFHLNPLGAAVSLDLSNYIFVTLVSQFDTTTFLPISSVVCICAVLVMGRVLLKERISRMALVSVGVSLVSIALLNV